MILKKKYFKKKGLFLAQDMIGNFICKKEKNKILKYLITEIELYSGEDDSACHAYKERRKKEKILYEEGGIFYIYICYGIHYMLNIITGSKGYPESIFIRGIVNFSGPGKLTKELKINKKLNGLDIDKSKKIWIEKPRYKKKYNILKLKRVGIKYALKKDQEILWRFKIF